MQHGIGAALCVMLGVLFGEAQADGIEDLNACADYGERGNHQAAADSCTRAIDAGDLSQDDLALAHYNRMISYRALRAFDKALADCDKVLSLDPDNLDAYLACANVYGGKGDFASAIRHADVVLKAEPDHAVAHNNRGNFLNQAGDYAQALQEFETAIRLDADYQLPRLNRGVALFNLGRFREAMRALEQAVEARPNDAYALLWLTLARGRSGIEVSPESVLAATDDISRVDWPWPIVAYFGGYPIDFADVVPLEFSVEADAVADADKDCEASFFYGQMAILQGKSAEAKQRLQHAADTCPKTFIEHAGALAELKRL
jgi:lipoprotein NlpI